MRQSKLIAICLLIVLLLASGCQQPTVAELDFLVLDSEHFTIYYTEGHEDPAEDVRAVLEANFDRIIENQQPAKQDKYVVWLSPTLRTFHQAIDMPDAPAWVVGRSAGVEVIEMVSPGGTGQSHSYEELLKVAVHEFAHYVTNRLAAEFKVPAVVWLWESIALYEAGQERDLTDLSYMQTGNFPSFLDGSSGSTDIYHLGYWVADYIINNWGWEGIRELVACRGDVRQALGVTEDEFYAGWYEAVKTW